MAVDCDDQREADRRFRPRESHGKNHEQNTGQRFGMRAEPPERDEIEVRRVQHQFDADENENGVPPRDRPGKTDGEQQRGD